MLIGIQPERVGNSQRMSDSSQGPVWWLACDGTWCPSETWTGTLRTASTPLRSSYPGSPAYQQASHISHQASNGLTIATLGVIVGFVDRNQIMGSIGSQQGGGFALAGNIVGFSLIAIFFLFIILTVALDGLHSCTGSGINIVNCGN